MINKNEWYRFSQNKGGHAIDFMKEFYGLSFAEAVKELLGEEGVGETNRRTAKEDAGRQKVCPIPLPGLELPERNESCEIARKYLIEQRKLSEQLVDQMIEKGNIYESKNYHNVVFVGRDKEQNPRYAAMRGTDENRYRGEARGLLWSSIFVTLVPNNFVFHTGLQMVSDNHYKNVVLHGCTKYTQILILLDSIHHHYGSNVNL